MTDLTGYLYLHDNLLSSVGESAFAGMTRLRYLNVGDNRISRLPDTLGNLTSLEELRSDNTLLEALRVRSQG